MARCIVAGPSCWRLPRAGARGFRHRRPCTKLRSISAVLVVISSVLLSPMVPVTPVSVTNVDNRRGDIVRVGLIDDRRGSIRIDADADAEIYSCTGRRRSGQGEDTEEKTNHSLFHGRSLNSSR